LFLVGWWSAPIDLSKAIKLKDVAFRSKEPSPKWVVKALRTVTPNHRHLQQISLYAHSLCFRHTEGAGGYGVRESLYGQWLELDHLLVQLWESHSIRLKISYSALQGREGEVARSRMSDLLPEVTSRGIAEFIEQGL
jgi:hypothetical protein